MYDEYDELVRALRYHALLCPASADEDMCAECVYGVLEKGRRRCMAELCHNAADTIEAQQKALEECAKQFADMAAKNEALQAEVRRLNETVDAFAW